MFFNSAKSLFMLMLFLSTLISISANSWLATWIGLEMNLLAFIPIMLSKHNILSSEASMKYFIIQALASSIFLTSSILCMIYNMFINNEYLMHLIMSFSLIMKMGGAPMHLWFPSVMEGLSWMNCLLLMTWQKLAPLMIISYVNCKMVYIIIIMSVCVGSLGGLNQTSTRKIMAYSSINHIGWMLMAMQISENLWQIYFLIYTLLSMTVILILKSMSSYHINQLTTHNYSSSLKFLLLLNLLSLGGLPPFLGFMPKWLIIECSVNQNMLILITFMILFSLITLYYYIQLSMSSFLINSSSMKWYLPKNYFTNYVIMIFSGLSILLLPIYSLLPA